MALDDKHMQELDKRLWAFNSVPVEGSDILTENAPISMYMSISGNLVILDKDDPTFQRSYELIENTRPSTVPNALTNAVKECNDASTADS